MSIIKQKVINDKRLDYIDSLRGLAVLMVVLVHVSQIADMSNFNSIIQKIFSDGAKGVQLFYIISGFTIWLSIYKISIKNTYSYKNFMIRRFFRIAPMWYMAIIVYLLIDGTGARYWLGDVQNISILNIIFNFIFLHGFNPYYINSIVPGGWSIGVEMVFYVIAPLLYKYCNSTDLSIKMFALSLILGKGLGKILLHICPIGSQELWSNYLFFWLPSQLPYFFIGITLFNCIYKKDRLLSKGSYMCLIAVLAVLYLAPDSVTSSAILLAGLFIVYSKGSIIVLNNSIMQYVGKLSYSVYLTHFIAIKIATKISIPIFIPNNLIQVIVNYTLVVLIAICISSITYYCIEQPMINWGRKLEIPYNNRKIETTIL